MITRAPNSILYTQWAAYIRAPHALDAYRFLVGIAAASTQFDCSCQWKGQVREFTFSRDGETPYAFITNQRWLLFYFRAPAVKKGGLELKGRLARDFCSFHDDPNRGNEWTVKLRSICDVTRLLTYIDLT